MSQIHPDRAKKAHPPKILIIGSNRPEVGLNGLKRGQISPKPATIGQIDQNGPKWPQNRPNPVQNASNQTKFSPKGLKTGQIQGQISTSKLGRKNLKTSQILTRCAIHELPNGLNTGQMGQIGTYWAEKASKQAKFSRIRLQNYPKKPQNRPNGPEWPQNRQKSLKTGLKTG